MTSTDPVLAHLRHLHIPMAEEEQDQPVPPPSPPPPSPQVLPEEPQSVPSPQADITDAAGELDSAWRTGIALAKPKPKRAHPKRTPRAHYDHLSAEQCSRIRRELIEADARETPRPITVRRLCRLYGVEPQIIERVVGSLW